MDIKVYILNAFAKTKEGGNPAGVVIDDKDLSVENMQSIANTMGFSETVFVKQIEENLFKVKFFTPVNEVDLCGHGTIALFTLLMKKKRINIGTYFMDTRAGMIQVDVSSRNMIFMYQSSPVFYDALNRKEIAESLNIEEDCFVDKLPLQIVSTGLKDIIIPVKTLKILDTIRPDYEKIKEVSDKYNVIGYHVFTFETLNNATANCRNFAPLYGIDEEAATGTSTGALCSYLQKYDIIKSLKNKIYRFEQGYTMGRPSEIVAYIYHNNNNSIQLKVGGKAILIEEKQLIIT